MPKWACGSIVVVTDASVVKLHLVMSVMGKGLGGVKPAGEIVNDHRRQDKETWVGGRLLPFELGYFRY